MSELTISVTIADRPYRLTIGRDEEETIRKAANEINNKIKFYAERFAFNDRQDLLAMVTLERATDALQKENIIRVKDEELTQKLDEIDRLLSESLNSN